MFALGGTPSRPLELPFHVGHAPLRRHQTASQPAHLDLCLSLGPPALLLRFHAQLLLGILALAANSELPLAGREIAGYAVALAEGVLELMLELVELRLEVFDLGLGLGRPPGEGLFAELCAARAALGQNRRVDD